jgi:hypothetical protein
MSYAIADWLGSLALIAAATGCQGAPVADEAAREQTWCFAIHCPSGGEVDASLGTDLAAFSDANVEICRNAVCATLDLGDIAAAVAAEVYWETQFPTYSNDIALEALVTANIWLQQGEYRLAVTYEPQSKDSLIDGDLYHLRVTSASGDILVDGQGIAVYRQVRYLGPGCGWCIQSTIEL